MSDAERIASMTELARRVWPGPEPAVQVAISRNEASVEQPGHEDSGPLATIIHPRALDALEAALLVLAGDLALTGDERNAMRPDILRMIEANVELGTAHTRLLVELEALAGRWETDATACEKADAEWGGASLYVAKYLRQVAAELRQRAKATY